MTTPATPYSFRMLEGEEDAICPVYEITNQHLEITGKLFVRDSAEWVAAQLNSAHAHGRAEGERVRELGAKLVASIDTWQASVEKIIGRPVGYKFDALEDFRAALATGEKP